MWAAHHAQRTEAHSPTKSLSPKNVFNEYKWALSCKPPCNLHGHTTKHSKEFKGLTLRSKGTADEYARCWLQYSADTIQAELIHCFVARIRHFKKGACQGNAGADFRSCNLHPYSLLKTGSVVLAVYHACKMHAFSLLMAALAWSQRPCKPGEERLYFSRVACAGRWPIMHAMHDDRSMVIIGQCTHADLSCAQLHDRNGSSCLSYLYTCTGGLQCSLCVL